MTPHWNILLDEASLADVLPPEFAHFARPVRDGLAEFLQGLPGEQQTAILRSQAALPPRASFSVRLGQLARCSAVLQKLGQILARDQRLAAELRDQLRELESLPPSVSLETIQKTLQEELGSLNRLGVTLEPPAIAEASVAVVIPFRRDENGATCGVFKVLKPGIEEQLERELALLESVGEYLDQRCDELAIPHLDYQESFQQVRGKLRDEVHLVHEQRHLQEARAFFRDDPQVQIPRLFEFCTPRVTAMERITGSKVTDNALTCCRRRQLARLVAKSLIARPVFSGDARALFHSDPHAGNLFLTVDGRLGILDWSLVGYLSEAERAAIAQVMLGAAMLDARYIVAVLANLADERLSVSDLLEVVADHLRQVRRGQFPGLRWLISLLDEATQRARLRVGADLMLFRKSLHTLEGVIADVGEAQGQIDRTLMVEFLKHFAAEWPLRWTRLPASRDCATRVSNLDLTRAWLSGPATAARFWTGHTLDLLQACGRRYLETS